MSSKLNKERLLEFLKKIGASATTPGDLYITGGTSALLIGWRDTTIDADIKFDPEPGGVFEAIPKIKREMQINVELAAPDNFIPALKLWKERSQFIGIFGKVRVFHYDFVAQALSKLSRGHEKDLDDVRAMLDRHLLKIDDLVSALNEIKPLLNRYPAIDENNLVERVMEFIKGVT